MKKLFIIAVLAIFGLSSANAQSAEYRNEVQKLFEKSTSKSTLSELLYTNLSLTLASKFSDEKIAAMSIDLANALYPDVIEAAVVTYYEIFSLDEIKKLNEFYDTPVGKKLAENTSKINQLVAQQLSSPSAQAKMTPIILRYMD